jgi:cell wall-associated NlpC family hydrolase
MNSKFSNNHFIILLTLFCSCSLLKNPSKRSYVKENSSVELKSPFNYRDYINDGNTFYAIEKANGTNLSVLRNMVQMQAKVNLSNAVKFDINSITKQIQSGSEGQTSSSFQQQATSIINHSIEKIVLIDSKTIKNNKEGEYEYWAVYSMEINDVKDLNKKQIITDFNQYNKVLKKNISIDTELVASENTSPNEYLTIKESSDGDELFRKKIEMESKSYIGVPYVWGGSSPKEGFDCSGFVRWVYKKSLNKLIPRTTLEQSREFKNIIKSNIEESNAGDLIYFKTIPNREISHVGIYLDKGKFIHAPNKREKVKIDELKGYWQDNYVGFASVSNFK